MEEVCELANCKQALRPVKAKRGIVAQEAAQTAASSDGPWHLANTPGLKLALANAYFASLGLPELTAHG
jgi:hypothetical protein